MESVRTPVFRTLRLGSDRFKRARGHVSTVKVPLQAPTRLGVSEIHRSYWSRRGRDYSCKTP